MRIRSLSLALLLPVVAGCVTEPDGPSDPAKDTYAAFLDVDIPSMVKFDDNLYYKDIHVGTGSPTAARNRTITVTYSGYLTDGTLFDTNVGQDSLVVPLNDGLIAGWVLGIAGMNPGGIRKLVIGSSYAYGRQGSSAEGRVSIPPNATIVFNVHLKAVK